MHSRLFQIANHPIKDDELLDQYSLPEFLWETGADYVVPTNDVAQDIEWLFRVYKGAFALGKEKNTFLIAPGGKNAFFKPKYKDFMEQVTLLTTTTFEAFVGEEAGPMDTKLDLTISSLCRAFNERSGFYVFQDNMGLMSLDAWMRRAKEGELYYFGTILDYHF